MRITIKIGILIMKYKDKSNKKRAYCEFIRINLEKKDFDIFVEVSKIQNFIVEVNKKLTKETVMDNISNELLKLEFEKNKSRKAKCLKCIVKEVLPKL